MLLNSTDHLNPDIPRELLKNSKPPTWSLHVSGTAVDGTIYENLDFAPGNFAMEMTSPYGGVFLGVHPDKDGKAGFDRFVASEAPGAITLVWRKTKSEKIELLLLEEYRPAAMPEDPNQTDPVLFLHPPMGFGEVVKQRLESALATATRETTEEIGRFLKTNLTQPNGGKIYPNPTIIESASSAIVYMEVLSHQKDDKGSGDGFGHEVIKGYDWYSVPEILQILRDGKSSDGAIIRQGPACVAILTFIADHHEMIFTLK